MNTLKAKLVKSLGRVPDYVPDWSKPVLKPFSGVYSKVYKRVYSSIKEEKLIKTPMGPYIYVRYWDCVERGCAIGTWERRYMDFFCSKIKEGDMVVDVGAYIGIFSLLASEQVGSTGCVYSFEPVPRNYERLMRNIKVNQAENVKAYNFGLSDKNETLSIYVSRENPAESSLCQNSWSEISKGIEIQKDVVKAKLMPFDQVCKDESLSEIKIVKIDVDGAELKVIKGMRNTLKSNNVELFMEIVPLLIERVGEGSATKLIEVLASCGFKTIYSDMSDQTISINQNFNAVIKWIGDNGYNFILSKNEEGIKWSD